MNRNKSKTGFTLLETLIALGLVTTLMTLAWSLFATFSRLETRSRKQVSDLEMTRTLVRQLRNDLDQLARVSFEEPSKANELAGVLSGSLSSSGLTLPDEPSEIPSGLGLGLRGNDEFNEAEINRKSLLNSPIFEGDSSSISFLIPATGQSGIPRSQRWLVVSYRWSQGEAGDTQNRDAKSEEINDQFFLEADEESNLAKKRNRVFTRRVASYQDYRQLSRFDTEKMLDDLLEGRETIQVGRSQGNRDREIGAPIEAVDEIPEIDEISFRYFDGKSWSSSYSASNGAYPVAVEMIFKIRRDSDSEIEDEFDELATEFGDEIEIGVTDDESGFESESSGNSPELEINPDFEPDAKRFLIYLGSKRSLQSPQLGDESDSLDFERPGIQE